MIVNSVTNENRSNFLDAAAAAVDADAENDVNSNGMCSKNVEDRTETDVGPVSYTHLTLPTTPYV